MDIVGPNVTAEEFYRDNGVLLNDLTAAFTVKRDEIFEALSDFETGKIDEIAFFKRIEAVI